MALTIKDLCELAEIDSEEKENEHIAVLLKDPIDRETTGEALEKLLGYDPTSAFDQIEMQKMLDDFIASNNLGYITDEDKHTIMLNAMNYLMDHRYEYQANALAIAIKESFADTDNEELSSIFDAWAEKHYSMKIVYDNDYDESESDDDDNDDEVELDEIANSGFVSDDDEDDEFDDEDDEDDE